MVEQVTRPAGVLAGGADGAALRIAEGDVLDPLVQAQCSLSVQVRRASGSIIGREAELTAISQEIKAAANGMAVVSLEGEPGIGKTRLLLEACDLAARAGFTVIAVTADEEIRGPFLVARSIFAAPAIRETAAGTPAEAAVRRVVEAMSGRDEPGFESLSPDAKLLRAFDLAGVAIAAAADVRPLALFIDDVQWADDDTLRMLRYAVRSDADRPIFLFLTVRPSELAAVTEAVNFVADLERMGLIRRLRPTRFTQIETAELLKNVLGGPVEPASATAMQVQSEGVPFIVEELARTHREAGTLQLVDGEWRLGRNAARLVPSAVRTLIQRRAARLPAATREALSDAAVLGRSFSLRDLRAVRARLSAEGAEREDLADAMRPAVEAGLLLQHPERDAADYTFTHVQVRDFADGQLSQSRRRQVHGAVVELLLEGGDPSPAGLPMLAQHALAAGDTERAAQFSIDAATAALASNAPEEALRLVDQALPVVSTPADRRLLLATRDDAYAVLRRSSERLQGLAELGALSEALRDPALEFDVQLRRSAALRMEHDEDAAAELARRVATRAAASGDGAIELRANVELGQALLRVPLGESFNAVSIEVDIDAAAAAFGRAAELAEQLGELGTLKVSRIRDWFVEMTRSGVAFELAGRIGAGEPIDDVLGSQSVAPLVTEARGLLERALALYERLDDRTGVMSTVIAMAYANYAPTIHLASSARHIEEIRRVTSRLTEFVTESERARQELQMLFGTHVYARAKVVPDLMVSRGEEAHRAARLLGDQATEFSAAGGVALCYLELGDVAEAERWLGLAASVASSAPSPTRARQLELWRGIVRAGAGDAEGMRRHLEQAIALATSQGRAAARCEALARMAIEAARLGAEQDDAELMDLAERSAADAKALVAQLPGHPTWGPQADAAVARVALARGDVPAAVSAAVAAIQALQVSSNEDANLEIVIPVARAIFAGGPPEIQAFAMSYLRLTLARVVQGTLDDAMRVRWLRGPLGSELVALVGSLGDGSARDGSSIDGSLTDGSSPSTDGSSPSTDGSSSARAGAFDLPDIDDVDRTLLRLLTEGHTNAEMAARVELTEEAVGVRLAKLLARLGVSNRAEATTLAFKGFAR
jgi:DNA-binding CsgD family transcriptional regulator/tetratricopeptide (TPR) repeat protein